MSFQQITVLGHLGRDPDLRFTPSGVPVASFSLATSKKFNDASGEQKEKTTWFNVTAWRKQAETVSQYLTKGSQVLVIGEIEEARAFTDRAGNNRASLEVTAFTIKFLGGKGTGGAEQAATPDTAPAEPMTDEASMPF